MNSNPEGKERFQKKLITANEIEKLNNIIEQIKQEELEKNKKDNKQKIKVLLLSIKRVSVPLFNNSQANVVLLGRKNISERLLILLYLFNLKIIKNEKEIYQFNGYHISQIIHSSKSLEDVKGIIEYLETKGIKDGSHISQIIRSSKSLQDIKDIVEYLEVKEIRNGSHISQIIRSSKSLEDVRDFIKYLETKDIKNGYHISQIIHSPKSLEDIKDIVEYLETKEIKDGFHISQIIHSSKSLQDIKDIVEYLEVKEIRNGSHISQIIRSSKSLEDVRDFIEYLETKGIRNGFHISQIIHSPKSLKDVKGFIKYLEAKGIRNGYYISQIINSSKSLQDVRDFIEYLETKEIKDGFHISQIIHSSKSLQDVRDFIEYLEMKGIRNDFHISQIIHSSKSLQDVRDFIEYLETKGIRNGYHISQIINSPKSLKDVKGFIDYLEEKSIKDGYSRARIIIMTDNIDKLKTFVNYLEAHEISDISKITRILKSPVRLFALEIAMFWNSHGFDAGSRFDALYSEEASKGAVQENYILNKMVDEALRDKIELPYGKASKNLKYYLRLVLIILDKIDVISSTGFHLGEDNKGRRLIETLVPDPSAINGFERVELLLDIELLLPKSIRDNPLASEIIGFLLEGYSFNDIEEHLELREGGEVDEFNYLTELLKKTIGPYLKDDSTWSDMRTKIKTLRKSHLPSNADLEIRNSI